MSRGVPWTPEDEEKLRELYPDRRNTLPILIKLFKGRTDIAVRSKARALGLHKKGYTTPKYRRDPVLEYILKEQAKIKER